MRGTPQQIIEKYNQLARDAQLNNDHVAAENFQQHAEHYTRLLGAAQKEIEAQREQQEREQQARRERQEAERLERAERQQQERAERQDTDGQNRNERGDQPTRSNRTSRRPRKDHTEQPQAAALPGEGEQPDIMSTSAAIVEPSGATDSGLVETPEEAPKPKRARAPSKTRAPRTPKSEAPAAEAKSEAPEPAPSGDAPEAAE